jgi:hypothetical protein
MAFLTTTLSRADDMLRFILMVACLPLISWGQSTGKAVEFSTLAGWASPGSGDGIGAAARFSFPTGVAVDGAGILYIADALNGTIRKVTPAGAVTMFVWSRTPRAASHRPSPLSR